MSFSDDFRWGTATASYQIEGAWNADDKGPSVWDQMSHWPGKIRYKDTGDITCDHFHRYKEDVDLMKTIGLNAYRLSLAWSRIIPAGVGAVSEKGLAFYDRLVDELLAAGVEPWITLFHWDYPLELYYRGGWLNGDSPAWFAEYTQVVLRRLGDRVKHWITLNEPSIFVTLGHDLGLHAPGLRLPTPDLVRIIHNVLKSHGMAVGVMRNESKDAQIGWAPAIAPTEPKDPDNPKHVKAAYEAQFSLPPEDVNFSFGFGLWTDPVFKGEYPRDYLEAYGKHLPKKWKDDMPIISKPLDFCGLNIYQSFGWLEEGSISWYNDHFGTGAARTNSRWGVTPAALYWGPKHTWERYKIPIAITENGMCAHDWVHADGEVHDQHRIDFLQSYIRELKRATNDGVKTIGYFLWTLIDNFEWAEGFHYRFGIVHVDFETLKRTPKDSARWYAELIKTNGAKL